MSVVGNFFMLENLMVCKSMQVGLRKRLDILCMYIHIYLYVTSELRYASGCSVVLVYGLISLVKLAVLFCTCMFMFWICHLYI